ncbi:hypothetical protein F2Q68_00011043 [Brassica cretica]|nr:hypothetical protein F2Q68_00011043 [Brassica cretica]
MMRICLNQERKRVQLYYLHIKITALGSVQRCKTHQPIRLVADKDDQAFVSMITRKRVRE